MTWLQHLASSRMNPENGRGGRLRGCCAGATARRVTPCPHNSTAARPHIANCCVGSCSRAGSTGARHHLQHPHEKNTCCDEPQNMPNGKNVWSSTRHGSQGSHCHSQGPATTKTGCNQHVAYVGRKRRVASPAHHGDYNHSHNCLAKHSTVEITANALRLVMR